MIFPGPAHIRSRMIKLYPPLILHVTRYSVHQSILPSHSLSNVSTPPRLPHGWRDPGTAGATPAVFRFRSILFRFHPTGQKQILKKQLTVFDGWVWCLLHSLWFQGLNRYQTQPHWALAAGLLAWSQQLRGWSWLEACFPSQVFAHVHARRFRKYCYKCCYKIHINVRLYCYVKNLLL